MAEVFKALLQEVDTVRLRVDLLTHLRGSRVQQVNGLVRQPIRRNIPDRHLDSGSQGVVTDLHPMKILIPWDETTQNHERVTV